MRSLIIELKDQQKTIKTWQLSHDQNSFKTVGTSKFADIQVGSNSESEEERIDGLFEYNQDYWKYVDLKANSLSPDQAVETIIQKPLNLKLGNLNLVITPFSKNSAKIYQTVSSDLEVDNHTSNLSQNLIAIYQQERCLRTLLLPIDKTFSLGKYVKTDVDLVTKFDRSSSWSCKDHEAYQIFYKTVATKEHKELLRQSDKMEKKDWVVTASSLAVMGLITAIFFLTPKPDLLTMASLPKPTPVYRDVQIPPPPQEQKPEIPKTASAPVEIEQPKPNISSSGGASQAASAIKSLSMGRVSQLVGKISATAGKSRNLVITSGQQADKGTTGRALSAVGKLEKSGTDWSKEGAKTGSFVAATGKASNTDAGQANLVVGKTGKSGVGLLEDESEIIGGLDREVIAAYIKSQLGQILYCYERQLSADPNLYGKVAIRFTIGSLGSVETQRVSETTLKSATVENCILQRVAGWKFPVPEGGTKVNVTYPFLFKSTN